MLVDINGNLDRGAATAASTEHALPREFDAGAFLLDYDPSFDDGAGCALGLSDHAELATQPDFDHLIRALRDRKRDFRAAFVHVVFQRFETLHEQVKELRGGREGTQEPAGSRCDLADRSLDRATSFAGERREPQRRAHDKFLKGRDFAVWLWQVGNAMPERNDGLFRKVMHVFEMQEDEAAGFVSGLCNILAEGKAR